MSFFNFIKQSLAHPQCIGCGSFFVKVHLFCEVCFQQTVSEELKLHKQKIDDNHLHYYALAWSRNSSSALTTLVYALKKNKSPLAWKFYARLFSVCCLSQSDVDKFDYIVPVPSAAWSSQHALYFAAELSKIYNIPLIDCLSKTSTELPQKMKSAEMRKAALERQVQFNYESFTENMFQSKAVLFVDDILTTGSSFLACHKTLGCNTESSILTLFYREKHN